MLVKIFNFVSKHKFFSLLCLVLWIGIALWGVMRLHFEEDITKVLPQNEKTSLTAKVLKQLNFSDKVSVIITQEAEGDFATMQSFTDALCDSLRQRVPNYFSDIQGIVPEEEVDEAWGFVYEHLPLFLEEEDYQYLSRKLEPDSLRALVGAHYRMMLTPAGMVAQQFVRKDPFSLTFRGLQKLQQLNVGTELTLTQGYLTTQDQRHILFFLNPTFDGNDTEHNAAFVAALEQLQREFNQQYVGKASCEFFGAPFISVSNATQIKTDILTTVLISLSVLCLLLIFFYRSVTVPVIAFMPSLFGVLTALAFLYVLKGSISAISISLGAVLLGVTIDYSLHILTHYKATQDTQELYHSVTTAILLSSITTAISFLCLLFVHSEVMQDLGIFASVGIMTSALLSLVMIPHFYRKNKNIEARKTILDRVGAYPFHRNKWVVAGAFLLIAGSFAAFHDVRFNGDIASVNFLSERYQKAQTHLESLTDSKYKSLYTTAYGNSLDEALTQNTQLYHALTQLKDQGKLQQFSSLGGIVLPLAEQQRRLTRWRTFWNVERCATIEYTLATLAQEAGFKPAMYTPFFAYLGVPKQPITDLQTYKALSAIPIGDFITEKDGFYTIANLVKLTEGQRTAFIKQIQRQTPTIVIDRKQISETFLGKLKDDVVALASYASFAIFFILLLFFRRIELVLLTLIPIALTGVVTTALMNLFGLEFNVFSMIVCTLVLGHSVDFSIFMTCALQKEYSTGKDELPVYKVSVLLASITTFLAIGTLIFAKHPALKSIASVSLIGIFSALLLTFVFYPSLFKFFISRRPEKGLSPISLRIFVNTILSITYYVVFSIILSNIGWLLLKIFPTRKTLWLRTLAAKLTTSVLYSNPFVRKRVENPSKIDFSKPSVMIANHSSWLDTLAIGMLTPRVSYMVNDWVYHSVVFGRYVQAMDFYPASEGIEKGMPIFAKNFANGYSAMIFPEGKRSESNVIHRFHKGAFLVAEHFKKPLTLVYIHGNSEVQPKGDFVIYDGSITVVAAEQIALDDPRFGSSPRERAKAIGKYFREQFSLLRQRIEGEDYLKKKLFLSYLYKELYIVDAVRADFKKRKGQYHRLSLALPQEGIILHWADDYGQADFLWLLTHPQRTMITVIADDHKRAIAQQSYLTRIRKIQYYKELPEGVSYDWEVDTREGKEVVNKMTN